VSLADAIEPNVLPHLILIGGLFLAFVIASLVPWKKDRRS
jgi:hypothetical protein